MDRGQEAGVVISDSNSRQMAIRWNTEKNWTPKIGSESGKMINWSDDGISNASWTIINC